MRQPPNGLSVVAAFTLGLLVGATPLVFSLFLGQPNDQLSNWMFSFWWLGLFLSGGAIAWWNPSNLWRSGLAMALGLPATLIIRFAIGAFINPAQSYLYFPPFALIASFILGPFAVFLGIVFASGAKGLRKN